MSNPFTIPVKCGGSAHRILIDPVTLKASVIDHAELLSRYAALRDLGGEVPMCYRMCLVFNELCSGFEDKPENFWRIVEKLAEFAFESTKEIMK